MKWIVRRCERSSDGWHGGDIDTLVKLLRKDVRKDGLDAGDTPSKDAKGHLVSGWYAWLDRNHMMRLTIFGLACAWIHALFVDNRFKNDVQGSCD